MEELEKLIKLCNVHKSKMELFYDSTYKKPYYHVIVRFPVSYMNSPMCSASGVALKDCIKICIESTEKYFAPTKSYFRPA